ncbi:DASH family cryptochrome [Neolewinella agarilytica]|uniref:Cryptochrome DASH n=1 Tax=Neolewinella agarilytica TaxID=478744 RepID=A0A1H9J6K5_9BACT|nr:DASH family cryptochrome [Neolewinella agarilytica]SEQ82514.1 deoxyribodipyrimidine photo-lyase (single-stranded DNA-specific) [Neolewinella agarilytica]
MSKRLAIVWFRRDLRLHDNEALTDALKHADEVLPVFIFDPREWRGTLPHTGLPKIGSHRAKFVLESVLDLKKNLRKRGADLLIRIGKPEEELVELTHQTHASWVFCNRERTQEELVVQNAVEANLWAIGREVYYSRGKLLYYTADLPFPITHTPDVFTQFRKETERITPVREPLPTPMRIPLAQEEGLDFGEVPTLSDFGIVPPPEDKRAAIHWQGGETAGLDRLAYYLFDSQAISTYKETRNGLIGSDYSTKFSAWLAHGCLSPKKIYAEVKAYEEKNGANDSTYWVIFELLWRDFFRLMGKKHGNAIFHKGGPKGEASTWRKDPAAFQRWMDGQTGTPFIDANMREIALTGFMSNRGRQNVASYLVKDLKLDWRLGAEYFEHQLTDYDVTSNWCNWNYVAGVGSDPREDRYFNILSQAQRYDDNGDYVKLWCPELSALPCEEIHQPDQLTDGEQSARGVKLGVDYPTPLIPSEHWQRKKGRR